MAIHITRLNGGNITIGSSGGGASEHSDTWYKYEGDTEWRTVSITGGISGGWDDEEGIPTETNQIPNITDVVELEIGTGVTSIGDYAFYFSDALTSVKIPDSVTSIGAGAFADCTSLTSVTIPSSVTSIGDEAFARCLGLTSVTIPDSVASISNDAFLECDLTSVTIVANGGEAASVKQMMIDAGVDENITWNMPS